MVLKGKAWKFSDNISTDHIQPSRYFHLRSDMDELSKHVLEGAREDFPFIFKPGDFVVAGKNFGLGSSREHAPTMIKKAGLSAVLAKSFARIFFRNSINIGLPLVICDTDEINEGDELEVDIRAGIVNNKSLNRNIFCVPLQSIIIQILDDNGLIKHLQKHGDFQLDL